MMVIKNDRYKKPRLTINVSAVAFLFINSNYLCELIWNIITRFFWIETERIDKGCNEAIDNNKRQIDSSMPKRIATNQPRNNQHNNKETA